MFFWSSKTDTHFNDWEQTEILNLINILPTLTSSKFTNTVEVENGNESCSWKSTRKDRKSYIEFKILFDSGHEFRLTFYKVYSNHHDTKSDYASEYTLMDVPKPLKAFEIELRFIEGKIPHMRQSPVSWDEHIPLNCSTQTLWDIKNGTSWVSRLKEATKRKMLQMVKIIDGKGDNLIRGPFI